MIKYKNVVCCFQQKKKKKKKKRKGKGNRGVCLLGYNLNIIDRFTNR
jgi:hypothetical protein